ncbi:MAG: Hsp20/alpha crystallin family protein, partial [Actinomycetota bacterium]|nr:Hsp20/alpha crystallin family protein [Actinomycetota bacterium]
MNEPHGNPFQGLIDVASEMNRMRQLGRYGHEAGQEERTHATAWVPTADILARGRDLIIRIELAGVDRQDIEVTFHENTLTISGERKNSPLD